MLRKYPPEKEQEKYKEIREAYDTLKDEKSRKNYDAYFHHEKDIKTLEDKYTEHMEAKNYNEAEKVLKKILIISPEIAHIKDKLGEVFFLEKLYKKSIEIYEKLIKENMEKALENLQKEHLENINSFEYSVRNSKTGAILMSDAAFLLK